MAHDETTRRRLESIDRAIEREALRQRRAGHLFWLLLLVPVAVAAWILSSAPSLKRSVEATVADVAPEVVERELEPRLAELPTAEAVEEVRHELVTMRQEQRELRETVRTTSGGQDAEEIRRLQARVEELEGTLAERQQRFFERIEGRLGQLEEQNAQTREMVMRVAPDDRIPR